MSSFCACVQKMLRYVTFAMGKVKLMSFSLVLDASTPPPFDPRCLLDTEMSLHTYTTFVKGNLGQGGGVLNKLQLSDDKCRVS